MRITKKELKKMLEELGKCELVEVDMKKERARLSKKFYEEMQKAFLVLFWEEGSILDTLTKSIALVTVWNTGLVEMKKLEKYCMLLYTMFFGEMERTNKKLYEWIMNEGKAGL